MRELAIVVGLFCLLSALSLFAAAPFLEAIVVSAWIVVAGAAIGVPFGVAYHAALYRALAPRGALPRGWLMKPLSLHGRLLPGEKPLVLSLCYLGAAGFVFLCLGLAGAACALLTAFIGGKLHP